MAKTKAIDFGIPMLVQTDDPKNPLMMMMAKCKEVYGTAEPTEIISSGGRTQKDKGIEIVCGPAKASKKAQATKSRKKASVVSKTRVK
jgi:hypothetical protein